MNIPQIICRVLARKKKGNKYSSGFQYCERVDQICSADSKIDWKSKWQPVEKKKLIDN